MKVQHLDHVAIAVRDVAASRDWYIRVLGLERRFEDEWGDVPTMVCAGETCVALFPAASVDASAHPEESPAAGTSRRTPERDTIAMRHFAFRVDRENFAAAQSRFRELGIAFESADHGIALSVYISDPDGHRIEITTYEV